MAARDDHDLDRSHLPGSRGRATCGRLAGRHPFVGGGGGGPRYRAPGHRSPVETIGARDDAGFCNNSGWGPADSEAEALGSLPGCRDSGTRPAFSEKRKGRRERDRYRRIAYTVARAGSSPDGPRGDWDYYERMGKFVASGAFDGVPGGGIDPETDTETYNGTIWLLARQTYWRDATDAPAEASPQYAAALRFYSDRAVPDDMRWSWAGQPEAFRGFRSAIDASNSAFRSATQSAGIVLANHFLSAVDAYVSVNMRIRRMENGSLSFGASIPAGIEHGRLRRSISR